MGGETYTQREDLFFLYLLPGAIGCQRLHLLASSSETPLIGCVSLARMRFSALCLNMTAWFSSRGLLPVKHLLFCCILTSDSVKLSKEKCTCVNNRCIRSKISGEQGRPWLLRGWIECEIVTLAGSRWTSNYYITPATGSSGQLERRCWNEDHTPAEAGPPGPRWSSPGERGRKAVITRRVGVNMMQSLFGLQLTSHTQPFQ